MKKKLKWKKKQIEDFEYWISVGPFDWEFSIELNDKNVYDVFVYFGSGDDVPLSKHIHGLKTLKDAKKYCETWLFNLTLELNRWL